MRLLGILAATLATFAWGLNFIVPFITQGYTIFDFALLQFLSAGLIAALFVATRLGSTPALSFHDWRVALGLGVVGYPAYFLCLDGAAIYAGPLVAPAILALVPIVLAVLGNLRQRTVAWNRLLGPLAMSFTGLLLVQVHFTEPLERDPRENLWLGVPLALAGVLCWTVFGFCNQLALEKRPAVNAGIWTTLIMVGAGSGMLAFAPIGNALGLFALPELGVDWAHAGRLFGWAICFGLFTTVGGALAWTVAVKRLPAALSAQLIVLEPVFGTILGLLVHGRWPTVPEVTGLLALLSGVVGAIRVFNRVEAPQAMPDTL